MANSLVSHEDAIRQILKQARSDEKLSFRVQANILKVPHQTLQAFCSGVIPMPVYPAFKRALARAYPKTIAHLTRISLDWIEDGRDEAGEEVAEPVPAPSV